MKIAIDNNGNKIQVSDDTLVNCIDGVYYLLTPAEQAAYDAKNIAWEADSNNRALIILRSKRDVLLSSCDWTVGNDAPFDNDKIIAWKAYRQTLRDLPKTYATNAKDVIWPTQPI